MVIFFSFFPPVCYLRSSFSLSLLVVTHISGHIAGFAPPPPHGGSCLAFL